MGRDNRGGRGRGGRGFRGGQGRGKSQGEKTKSLSSKQLKMKFFSHRNGRERQAVTYDTTVKDHIVQYVQKTYKNGQDIAASLRDLVIKDLNPLSPTRGHI